MSTVVQFLTLTPHSLPVYPRVAPNLLLENPHLPRLKTPQQIRELELDEHELPTSVPSLPIDILVSPVLILYTGL